jgi:hypothetical protein
VVIRSARSVVNSQSGTGGAVMIRCDQCGNNSNNGEAAHRLVVVERPKIYLNEAGEPKGLGWEIEKEILICQACKKANLDLKPAVETFAKLGG